jgi:sugar diacid utilization regulator
LDPNTIENLKVSMKSNLAVLDETKADSPSMLRKTLTVKGKIVGYLNSPCYSEPFAEEEIAVFEIIGDLCALYMGVNMNYGDFPENLLEFFIGDLLAGRITDVYLIRERMDYFHWNIKGTMRILSVRSVSRDSSKNPQITLEKIEKHFPKMTVFPYGAFIKVILLMDDKFIDADEKIERLAPLLKGEGLCAGLSRVFTKINEFTERNEESNKALELGPTFDPGLSLYRYDDYAIYHMLEECQPHTKVMKFCHSAIIKLAEYDRKHSGELVDTLKYYLFNNRNATEAANYVHVHRNTMNYRMNKIRELLDVDFDDTKISFELMLSFYILDYYEAMIMRGSREMIE